MCPTNYTYSTNVPQSHQKISATQRPIQSNFQAISDIINVNHVGFSDPINYGKHTYTSLPVQSLDPDTLNGEMAVYCKATGSPNPAEIFYRYPNNGSVVQLTGGGSSGGAGASSPGYSFMSPTVFMMWGFQTGIVNGSNVIVFPSGGGFPSFGSTPYQIYFTAATNYTNLTSTVPYISASSTTQFTLLVNNTNYATSIYWLAIGSV
jgi:hypothetical protein